MLTFILIVIALIVSCTLFAMLGSRIGAKMEEKTFGSGTVEASINSGLEASTLGAFLGIIPVLVFVIVLVGTVMTSPGHTDAHGAGGSEAAAAH